MCRSCSASRPALRHSSQSLGSSHSKYCSITPLSMRSTSLGSRKKCPPDDYMQRIHAGQAAGSAAHARKAGRNSSKTNVFCSDSGKAAKGHFLQMVKKHIGSACRKTFLGGLVGRRLLTASRTRRQARWIRKPCVSPRRAQSAGKTCSGGERRRSRTFTTR